MHLATIADPQTAKTQKGIKAFQKAKGLPANGIVDKKTWKALLGM